jgi:hypothetical protein
MELIRREDRYDLYHDNGHKVASTSLNTLSKQNCDEIFGVIDEAFYMNEYIKARHSQEECIGFIDGFNKAMELYQPTEIEVEIEVEPKENKDLVPLWTYENKLDSNGNLILRKL